MCLCQTKQNNVVINEIMASASKPRADYIEIFNRGDSPIWLDGIRIAYTGTTGRTKLFGLGSGGRALGAGEYHVVTKDAAAVMEIYSVGTPSWLGEEPSMPNLAATGAVAIVDADSSTLDEVHYSDSWHNPLLLSHKDVALERIDPYGESDDASNWTSAQTESGNATPTSKNSSARTGGADNDGPKLKLRSKYFCPRGGTSAPDVMEVEMRECGGGVTMTIYDAEGRPVARPYNNVAAGNGLMTLTWDGRDADGVIVGGRTYIVVVETWDTGGRSWTRKETVTVVE